MRISAVKSRTATPTRANGIRMYTHGSKPKSGCGLSPPSWNGYGIIPYTWRVIVLNIVASTKKIPAKNNLTIFMISLLCLDYIYLNLFI